MRLLNVFESISFVLTWGGAQQQRSDGAIGKLNPARRGEDGHCHSCTGQTLNCHQAIAPYGGRIPTCPTGVRFHIQQESDIPASTQLYNQICFAIAARHYPPGHRLPSTRQLTLQTNFTETRSKVYRQLETDGVVEAMAGSGIYARPAKPREIKTPPHIRNRV